MGKLFVIEGTDGSGKSTQLKMVCDKLDSMGIKYRKIVFPRYEEDSATLIRMYLGGAFGKNPGDVNPYAASTFFAVDRYASFKTDWEKDYLDGVPIICDRYTTSNAIHQASKLPDMEIDGFLDWLFDYEYRMLGIPAPTDVFFLDMPSELSFQLIKKRQGESGDIHELDHDYLRRCREKSAHVCDRLNWLRVPCAKDGVLRTPEEINSDIMERILK